MRCTPGPWAAPDLQIVANHTALRELCASPLTSQCHDASPNPSSTGTFAANFSTPPRISARRRALSTSAELSKTRDREMPTQSRCVGEYGRKPACLPQILREQPDGKADSSPATQPASAMNFAGASFGVLSTDGEAWLLEKSRSPLRGPDTFLKIRPLKPILINRGIEGKRLAHPPTSALSIPACSMSDASRVSDLQQSPASRNGPRPLPQPPSDALAPAACPSPELGASGEPLTLYYLMKMGPTIRLYDKWDELVSALSRGASCHYDVYTNLMDACNAWLHVLQPHYAEAAAWAFAHQSEYLAAHGVNASVAASPRSTSPPPSTPAATDASLEKSDAYEDHLATYFVHGQHVDVPVSRSIHVQEELAADGTGSASVESDGSASPRSLSPPPFMAPPSPALLAGGLSSPSVESLGGFSLQGMIRRARVDSATPGNAWYGVVRGFTTGVLQGPYEYMVEDAVVGYNGTFYRGFQERRAAYNWYMEHRKLPPLPPPNECRCRAIRTTAMNTPASDPYHGHEPPAPSSDPYHGHGLLSRGFVVR
ncbi:hypothetical protein FA95DRAFT_1576761 [Auriscalpium vulgare]|uniref:Uncharacterized protein n=1 Tax=Auriscalpium vulgare TaxID=40419 RepID=A0ACB8R9K9_9AGAM|nr:hypothetical protein FA95DRAFT_1576761 [Auriscalpium vulgare]